MKQLTIILATHDFVSPIRGGAGLLINKTAIELNKRGHNLKILGPSDKNNIKGIEVVSLPHISKDKPFILTASKFIILFTLQLFRTKCDIIFTHGIAGIPAVIFGKIFNKKVIINVTDIHTEYLKVSHNKFPWNLFILFVSQLEYFSFKYADKVIVISNVMKDILIEKGVRENKLLRVYLGVESDRFSSEKQNKSYNLIIHHGGVDFQDGVHYIAEAAPMILEKYPDTRFMIVGAGACLESVKKIAEKNGVEKSFTFTGWKPYNEMMKYLKCADIGLITRPNTLPNNTVPTLKLLEYWASGTAVVSSRLNAIQEISSENNDIVFFEPDNYRDLAEKVIGLIKNHDLLAKLQKNGRIKAINKFDWNNLVVEIADIIEEE